MENTDILIYYGLIEKRKYKDALEYITGIATKINSSKSYELKGSVNYLLLNIENAISDFTKAIELDNKNDLAFSNLGYIFRERQKYNLALEYFEKAQSINESNIFYTLNIIHIHLCLKNSGEAIKLADKILNIFSDNIEAMRFKADALCDLKEYKKAADLYEIVVANSKEDGYTYNGLAFCQIYIGELNEAKNNFLKAISLLPEFSYPYDNLGYVYYLQKDYKQAIKYIDQAIEIDESNSWAYKNRALVYLATGKKEDAKKDLQFAIELGYSQDYDDEVEQILIKEF